MFLLCFSLSSLSFVCVIRDLSDVCNECTFNNSINWIIETKNVAVVIFLDVSYICQILVLKFYFHWEMIFFIAFTNSNLTILLIWFQYIVETTRKIVLKLKWTYVAWFRRQERYQNFFTHRILCIPLLTSVYFFYCNNNI